jgi:hypothetical protein
MLTALARFSRRSQPKSKPETDAPENYFASAEPISERGIEIVRVLNDVFDQLRSDADEEGRQVESR